MNKHPLTKSQIFKILKKIDISNLKNEKIELIKSSNRILSADIICKINLPPFKNSAVDGYALRDKDLNNSGKLKCSHRITAGNYKKIKLKENEVARIFTGANMPQNSSTVIMQENVSIVKNGCIIINKIPSSGENCRKAGEDVSKGDKILSSGEKINSTNLNLIAAIGKRYVQVKKKIKVGYYTSGNELKKPTERLKKSEINNSNEYSLHSLLDDSFIKFKYLGILKDSKKKILDSFDKHIKKFNVIITTGGASVGEEDHLVNILKEKGKVFFWKTAIKPGRPLAIGKIGKTILICLPGNPVSVHLLYGMIVRPFLEFLSGSKLQSPKRLKAIVNFSMNKKTKRLEWLRVKVDNNNLENIYVYKYPKQGSAMISSIAYSDGIIEIPENVSHVKKGDKYDLYLFDNLFS